MLAHHSNTAKLAFFITEMGLLWVQMVLELLFLSHLNDDLIQLEQSVKEC